MCRFPLFLIYLYKKYFLNKFLEISEVYLFIFFLNELTNCLEPMGVNGIKLLPGRWARVWTHYYWLGVTNSWALSSLPLGALSIRRRPAVQVSEQYPYYQRIWLASDTRLECRWPGIHPLLEKIQRRQLLGLFSPKLLL